MPGHLHHQSTLTGLPRESLRRAVARVPAGRWGVAVSGGADSTATFHLLARRAAREGDLSLVLIHLDHELRGDASAGDAAFAIDLAQAAGVPVHLRGRAELEVVPVADTEPNLSARLRRLRLAVHAEAVAGFNLDGVVLGHHADDVAETILLRLVRGSPRSGTMGLYPLRHDATVGGVRLLRPMLRVRRARLRGILARTGRPWREDASNAADVSPRNRLRRLLARRDATVTALLRLADAAAEVEDWLRAATPVVGAEPTVAELVALNPMLRRRALRRWLVAGGLPERDAGPLVVDLALAVADAIGPRAADLPGGLRATRRKGRLSIERSVSGPTAATPVQ